MAGWPWGHLPDEVWGRLAAAYPERVRALVLGCTSPGGPFAVERGNDVRRSLAQGTPAEIRRALIDLMYTPEWTARHPGPYATLGDRAMPGFARRRHLLASNGHDAWEALPSITARTLVVHGTADRFNPAANAPPPDFVREVPPSPAGSRGPGSS